MKPNMEKIKIEGYRGTWYVVTHATIKDMNGKQKTVYALEHEIYGEDAAPLFVDYTGKVISQLEGYGCIQDIISDMDGNEWQ
ncbi:MAG: hypothetical protein ACRC23_02005 [Aeromonas jandaei]